MGGTMIQCLFPEKINVISELCATNESFSELCDDYGEVVAALERSKKVALTSNAQQQLMSLKRELEEEIRFMLSAGGFESGKSSTDGMNKQCNSMRIYRPVSLGTLRFYPGGEK